MLTGPGGMALGFGTLDDHEAPGWPNEHGSKQFHLDLAVDDLDASRRRVRRSGRDAAGRAARRDLAGAARPQRPPVLPHPGRELGLTDTGPPRVRRDRCAERCAPADPRPRGCRRGGCRPGVRDDRRRHRRRCPHRAPRRRRPVGPEGAQPHRLLRGVAGAAPDHRGRGRHARRAVAQPGRDGRRGRRARRPSTSSSRGGGGAARPGSGSSGPSRAPTSTPATSGCRSRPTCSGTPPSWHPPCCCSCS